METKNIVPPVLHIKLKIGNDLLSRLRLAAQKANKEDELMQLLKKNGLNKDRKSDRIIYSEMKGGDVKKFSKMWDTFQKLTPDPEFQDVVKAIQAFDNWSQLASCTDLNLLDEHLQKLCCRNDHPNERCCATSSLAKMLEKLGGFANSVKVHVMAQHIGAFAWEYKILGGVSEEGIERLHSRIKDLFKDVSRSDNLERARITCQQWGVQVQLADLNKSLE